MVGRAGRAGIDSIGEAYVCVMKGLLERAIQLITAELSPVVSQVKDITKVALEAVASGLATKRNHVCLMMNSLLLFSSASANEKQSLMKAILREVKESIYVGTKCDFMRAYTKFGTPNSDLAQYRILLLLTLPMLSVIDTSTHKL